MIALILSGIICLMAAGLVLRINKSQAPELVTEPA